jgi:hypothetical protein
MAAPVRMNPVLVSGDGVVVPVRGRMGAKEEEQK